MKYNSIMPIGPIKHSSSTYLKRLEKIIAAPIARKESSIFLWPIGNAKSLHLPEIAKKYFYVDLNQTPNLDVKKIRDSKKPIIVNGLDSLEDQKVFDFIKQISPKPHPIMQLHLRNATVAKIVMKSPGGLDLTHGVFSIPLPTDQEMLELITIYSRDYHLHLTRNQIKELQQLSDGQIMLFKAAIRKFVQNPKLNIKSIVLSKEFALKKELVDNSLPKNDLDLNYLSNTEAKVYSLLHSHPNETMTRDAIATEIWGENAFDNYSDWAIDKTIARLREKLIIQGQSPNLIKTVKGKGYLLNDQTETQDH